MKHYLVILMFLALVLASGRVLVERSEDNSPALYSLLTVPKALRSMMTLGHPAILDDLSLLWLMQTLGNSATKIEVPELTQKVLTLIRQEPRVESIYSFSCLAFIFFYQVPEICEEITRMGMQLFEKSWYLPALQGFVFVYVLDEVAKGIPYYQAAASKPRAPKYLLSLATKLKNKETSQEMLNLMLNQPGLEPIQEKARERQHESSLP